MKRTVHQHEIRWRDDRWRFQLERVGTPRLVVTHFPPSRVPQRVVFYDRHLSALASFARRALTELREQKRPVRRA